MIKAVFFDIAGTLLHKPQLYNTLLTVFGHHGLSLDLRYLMERHKLLSEATEFPDTTDKVFYQRFNAELCFLLGVSPTKSLLEDIFNACHKLAWQPFEDSIYLQQISLPKGVISNWDLLLRSQITVFNVTFSWVVGSAEESLRKPDPLIYKRMLELTGFEADTILYVGDSVKLDIIPSLNLGIKSILLDRYHFYSQSNLVRIRGLNEISKYL